MIDLIDECPCCEPNTDYMGNDINADPDDKDYGARVESAVACQGLCQARRTCHFFTYNQGSGTCWLKKTDSGRTYSANGISGKRFCGNCPSSRYL